jgi:hypothetical protein
MMPPAPLTRPLARGEREPIDLTLHAPQGEECRLTVLLGPGALRLLSPL